MQDRVVVCMSDQTLTINVLIAVQCKYFLEVEGRIQILGWILCCSSLELQLQLKKIVQLAIARTPRECIDSGQKSTALSVFFY